MYIIKITNELNITMVIAKSITSTDYNRNLDVSQKQNALYFIELKKEKVYLHWMEILIDNWDTIL